MSDTLSRLFSEYMGELVLRPAYGRVYNTQEEMLKDWNDGKDFYNESFGYCSNRDYALLDQEYSSIMLLCTWRDKPAVLAYIGSK